MTRDNGKFARADIDYLDADGQVVAQMQDYECVIDRQLEPGVPPEPTRAEGEPVTRRAA